MSSVSSKMPSTYYLYKYIFNEIIKQLSIGFYVQNSGSSSTIFRWLSLLPVSWQIILYWPLSLLLTSLIASCSISISFVTHFLTYKMGIMTTLLFRFIVNIK